MAEPDPRLAALQNIQDTSRAYGRSRRRGEPDANVDPAFRAAVEIADPEQRRAALAQYARQRAQGLFPQQGAPQGAQPAMQGRDIVAAAFPEGNAFAGVQRGAAPLPRQADVLAQLAADDGGGADDRMYADLQTYGGPGDLEAWQNMPLPAAEDAPESVRARTNFGKALLAPRYAESVDEGVANEMLGPNSLATPGDVRAWQSTRLPGAEDSPEAARARQNSMKTILAPRGSERIDEMNEREDTRRIEGAQAGNAVTPIMARRRVR